jgi:sphingomyelin phosphodiesterase
VRQVNLVDPVIFPPALLSNATDAPIGATANLSTPLSRTLAAQTVQQIQAIIHAPNSTSECDKCKAGLVAAQALARIAPWEVPGVMIQLCNLYHYDVRAVVRGRRGALTGEG